MRNKSNIAKKETMQQEPEVGPGSSTCYCRRMDRRVKVQEARVALRAGQGGQNVGRNDPRFADILIADLAALEDLHEAMRNMMIQGAVYRVRVALVGMA